MLPPFIIEQIRKREEEERKRYEQPQLDLPLAPPGPAKRREEHDDGGQRGVIIVESIAPNAHFEGGEGINTLTSADQAAPLGGAVFHDNHVWVRAA